MMAAAPQALDRRPLLLRLGEFVKFSHTIFALPFALVAMLVAARGLPSWQTVALILLCMVAARTAAMAFNRLADWEIDKRNPRTASRSRLITRFAARMLVMGSSVVFVLASLGLNPLCGVLSPLALIIIFFYSITKRFTSYSHFFLGLALAVAPVGAWLAVRGSAEEAGEPLLLALGTLFWVFGFDLIYATQDTEFDRKAGLYSFPSRYGIAASLLFAKGLHMAAWLCFVGFGLWVELGWPYLMAMGGVFVALVAEHWLAKSGDVQQVNKAFFQVNALVSLMILAGVAVSLWMQ